MRAVPAAVALTVALVTRAFSAEPGCKVGLAVADSGGQEVLDLADAATLLRIEKESLIIAAERGEVPGRNLLGMWRFSRAALIAWLAGSDRPEECFRSRPSKAAGEARAELQLPWAGIGLSSREMKTTSGRGAAAAPTSVLAQTEERAPERFGEEPELDTAREVALREQAVLLRPGEITLEAGLFFTREDRNVLSFQRIEPGGAVPVIGDQKRETFSAVLIGRYGVIDDLELEGSVPFQSEAIEFNPPGPFKDVSSDEFGDVDLRIRYAPLREGVRRPAVIVSAEGRIPTDGSEAYGLGGGLSLIKSIDPTALFASINYLHTFNADSRDLEDLEPEDTIDATLGFAFAMNERLSFGSSITATFDLETELDQVTLPSEETYSLSFFLTSLLTNNLYVEPSVSFRLNGPEDAVTFGLSLPYTFRPWGANNSQ